MCDRKNFVLNAGYGVKFLLIIFNARTCLTAFRISALTECNRPFLTVRVDYVISGDRPLSPGDLNRWTQHLFSNDREGDVDHETKTEDLLFPSAEVCDVGPLAERRLLSGHRKPF